MNTPAPTHGRCRRPVLVAMALCLTAGAAHASWWSGGPYGAEVNGLSMASTNSNVLYAATNHGVYRTGNGGASWTRTSLEAAVVRVVAVAPDDADTVYAGTNDGIRMTEDGGATWVPQGLSGAKVNAIAIDPTSTNTVFAGTGEPLSSGGTAIRGLFKSINGGDSWQHEISSGVKAVLAIVIDRDNPLYVYAAVCPESGPGLRRSTDGGETWDARQVGGLSTENVVALTQHDFSSNPLWALVEDDGLYYSTTNGESWTSWFSVPAVPSSANQPCALALNPDFPLYRYLAVRCSDCNEVWRSLDGWIEAGVGLPWGGPSAILIDPDSFDLWVALSRGGVFKSTDYGESWSLSSSGMRDFATRDLAVDSNSSEAVFAVGTSTSPELTTAARPGEL